MNNIYRQTGASIWVILPWLIALVLATALMLLLTKYNAIPQIYQPQIPKTEQISPNEQGEQAWQPTFATPNTHPNADTAPTIDSYHDAVSQASLSVVNMTVSSWLILRAGNRRMTLPPVTFKIR